MAKKRGKPISFDAMVKFFMKNYEIPTKSDMDRIMARLDHLEALLTATPASSKKRRAAGRTGNAATANDSVLLVIKRSRQGVGLADIQAKTGYDAKKIRNILYRLHKTGKIQRKNRGVYTAA
jgi:hypothetical protein